MLGCHIFLIVGSSDFSSCSHLHTTIQTYMYSIPQRTSAQLFALTLQKSMLALDVPVYTIWSACVNSAFDSVYHKLDLSGDLVHFFCKLSAKYCIDLRHTQTYSYPLVLVLPCGRQASHPSQWAAPPHRLVLMWACAQHWKSQAWRQEGPRQNISERGRGKARDGNRNVEWKDIVTPGRLGRHI